MVPAAVRLVLRGPVERVELLEAGVVVDVAGYALGVVFVAWFGWWLVGRFVRPTEPPAEL